MDDAHDTPRPCGGSGACCEGACKATMLPDRCAQPRALLEAAKRRPSVSLALAYHGMSRHADAIAALTEAEAADAA